MKYILTILSLTTSIATCLPAGYGGYGGLDLYSDASFSIPGLRSYGRDRALLEKESKVSQLDSAYSYAQEFTAGLYHPKAIVDTLREEDKYGNDGGLTRKVSLALINTISGLSKGANTIIDAPFNKATKLGRVVTQNLNDVGAYLVGL